MKNGAEKENNRNEEPEENSKVFLRRWYILILFSFFTLHSCAVWNTWGPIAKTAKKVYGWTDGTLTLFTLWGCLDFPIFFLPSAWLLGRSLRWSVVIAAFCMLLGSSIRCLPLVFPLDDQAFTYLCHAGAIINAICGPVAMSAPIQISSAWFPPTERTFATSIGQMFNALGVGVSFIFGTFIVREASEDCELDPPSSDNILCLNKESDLKLARDDIDILLLIHGGISLVIFLLILLYFPSQPPKPPSISATEPRTLFLEGFKTLLKSRTAWFTMITYSMSQGLVQMWQSVMIINILNLEIEGVTEKWASMLGIVISFVAVAASIGFAFILKWFRKRMKHVIILLLAVSGTIFIVVALLFQVLQSFC
ncbi:disrupted in renal carcinoma protein 2 homolog isoform X3 [Eurytemora carolleeae]|uniref:disrupted in renal carcinoma protein 2 homolog isoform X3 n=1 Tax=Eurytemora carolleeae TaxID=1294199 RepID=UPI000C766104|nr:disrupted in renal carcinoma protein 2 homolog isoform X3 [Eurytemora carolleeae]|eukprot:XP_023321916.1 disrupted in renal carcinoma protein 2 homolog isoform X3 [Eurytemora affinis]